MTAKETLIKRMKSLQGLLKSKEGEIAELKEQCRLKDVKIEELETEVTMLKSWQDER